MCQKCNLGLLVFSICILSLQQHTTMATARITFRIILAILLILVVYYVGRPLYWKISATIHDIRHNKQTVSGGISQIVYEAQKSVGWFHDSGVPDTKHSASRQVL